MLLDLSHLKFNQKFSSFWCFWLRSNAWVHCCYCFSAFSTWHHLLSWSRTRPARLVASSTSSFGHRASLHHPLLLLLLLRESVLLDSMFVDKKCPIFVQLWVVNLVAPHSLFDDLCSLLELYLSERSSYLHHHPPTVNCFSHASSDLLEAICMI